MVQQILWAVGEKLEEICLAKSGCGSPASMEEPIENKLANKLWTDRKHRLLCLLPCPCRCQQNIQCCLVLSQYMCPSKFSTIKEKRAADHAHSKICEKWLCIKLGGFPFLGRASLRMDSCGVIRPYRYESHFYFLRIKYWLRCILSHLGLCWNS